MTNDLLIELGTEELPPKALKTLSEAFSASLIEHLEAAQLSHGESESFAAPRRLALLLRDVPAEQGEQSIKKTGPAVQAAFDDQGHPTKAAEGFARSCGVSVDELERIQDGKVEKLYFETSRPGQSLTDLLPPMVEKALAALPIPKRMRWGDNDYQFVRPVQWLVTLHGDRVIPADIMGQRAGADTRGHRFHAPGPLHLNQAGEYAAVLRERGKVEPGFATRRKSIEEQVHQEARQLGGRAVIDPGLLDEVTALVEWPVAVAGHFEKRFLNVPQEALITTMEDNQKYFAVLDDEGKLMPHFITIANIESRDVKQLREGNERVIRPRFADAEFFWNQDRKHRLEDNNAALRSIVFQNKLGKGVTVYDKTRRVAQLARWIAQELGYNADHAERAGQLCKADLASEMVLEFDSMQGIAGRYYAEHDGEPGDVPAALQEQYQPKFSGDALPQSDSGRALALADRLDTLLAIWAVGQKPTGSKDPFALRRAALGVIRILVEGELDLNLGSALREAQKQLGPLGGEHGAEISDLQTPTDEVKEFIYERMKHYFIERGYSALQFEAVRAVAIQQPLHPADFARRMAAINAFGQLEAADSLSAADKRIRNIFKKFEGELPETVDPGLFESPAETTLWEQLQSLQSSTQALIESGEYEKAFNEMAGLREPVDHFFDEVMVMAEDEALKRNRLALLGQLRGLFLQIADLSQLQE
ncbi:MAG: glycine--tRNA ligase subunit beta [Pseudomonadota bacterium]